MHESIPTHMYIRLARISYSIRIHQNRIHGGGGGGCDGIYAQDTNHVHTDARVSVTHIHWGSFVTALIFSFVFAQSSKHVRTLAQDLTFRTIYR